MSNKVFDFGHQSERVGKKVLVLGGSGMLGHVIVKYLSQKGFDVTFSVRDQVPNWMPLPQAVGVVKFDATKALPDLSGYSSVINCVGNIKQKKELKAVDFYHVNSVFPWRLSLACKKVGARLVHISSDCVFSGKLPQPERYSPSETLDAEDDYGISKALGECSDAVVIRTSIIGPCKDQNLGLFEWFRRTIKSVNIPGYTNHIWSGVTTLYLAQFIEGILLSEDLPKQGGLVQLSSKPISKFTLLNIIRDVFQENWGWQNVKIVPTEADRSINRAIVSAKETDDIHQQLVELRDWMKFNDE